MDGEGDGLDVAFLPGGRDERDVEDGGAQVVPLDLARGERGLGAGDLPLRLAAPLAAELVPQALHVLAEVQDERRGLEVLHGVMEHELLVEEDTKGIYHSDDDGRTQGFLLMVHQAEHQVEVERGEEKEKGSSKMTLTPLYTIWTNTE